MSYKNALKQFNENAVERNNELILSLENNGLLPNKEQQGSDQTEINIAEKEPSGNTVDGESGSFNDTDVNNDNTSVPVDTVKVTTILPTTLYTLQTYDIVNGVMDEELLSTPSYLVGLNRNEVIEYLYDYMQDLPWSEFEQGLTSFELMSFSTDKVVLRKTYNADMVEDRYFLKSQNNYIVVYYGDQKTVFDYTSVSVENLSQYEQLQLEAGIFVKDLDELYAVLENYSS